MDYNTEGRRDTARNVSLAAIVIAIIALIVGIFLPISTQDDTIKPLTYENVSPIVKEYLVLNDLVDEDGLISVPNTSDPSSNTPSTATIEQVVDQLIASGKFDYLKGEKGDIGTTGATGATGPQGATGAKGDQGIPGSYAGKGDKGDKGDTGATGAKGDKGDAGVISTTSGLTLSGGTLSLKPCAIDQVLMSNGSTWDCATVSAGGVSGGTTTVSATLNLSGTSLEASITDSDGNTVNTPPLDLSATFATDLELSNAITTAVAGLNLSQYATDQDLTDAISALNLNDYATTADMNTAIATATSSLVSQTDLTDAIDALNLSGYATTANLTALTTRVSTLETTSTDHEGRISTLETNIAQGYVTDTELTTALGGYYTKSETYTQTEVDTKLTNLENTIDSAKQDTLPTCSDGQVIKYNTTSSAWECAADLNNVSGDGSNFATENWTTNYITSQNFATQSALNTLSSTVSDLDTDITNIDTRVATLEGAGYITTSALTPYLKTADLSTELISRLNAGVGISLTNNSGAITITSTATTDVFEIVNGHDTVAAPDANKIYVDVATNPTSEWVYANNAWLQVGEINAELTDYYTKTETNNAISSAISTNNSNYTTTTDLTTLLATKANQSALNTTNSNLQTTNDNLDTTNTNLTNLDNKLTNNYTTTTVLTGLLADKQDSLPACTAGQVVKYSLTDPHWVCANDDNTHADLTGYAKETWVTSQITTNNNNYTTTTNLNSLLAAKADQTALDATNTALGTETTNRTSADTAHSNRLDAIEADYLTSSDLGTYATTAQIADMATETWVNNQGFLKSADLTGYATTSWVEGKGYVTSTSLTSTLASYATDSELTTATSDMETKTYTSSTYVPKSALNCNSTQALIGTGTNGTISCRAISNITSGTLASSTNLITANTLNAVLTGYYNKTEIDTKLENMATGADGPLIFEIVTTMPAESAQEPNTIYLLKTN